MGIHVNHLRELIVRPVLRELEMHSRAAENVVLGTAAVESAMGHWLRQNPRGPALGIYQCEVATHNDLIWTWLHHKPELWSRLVSATKVIKPEAGMLVGNLWYATGICRLHYRRVPDPLPDADDIDGLGGYWKRYYNTRLGAGTVEHWREAWAQHCWTG